MISSSVWLGPNPNTPPRGMSPFKTLSRSYYGVGRPSTSWGMGSLPNRRPVTGRALAVRNQRAAPTAAVLVRLPQGAAGSRTARGVAGHVRPQRGPVRGAGGHSPWGHVPLAMPLTHSPKWRPCMIGCSGAMLETCSPKAGPPPGRTLLAQAAGAAPSSRTAIIKALSSILRVIALSLVWVGHGL
jgi:hypothetical protein